MSDNKKDLILCITILLFGMLVMHRVDVMRHEAGPPPKVDILCDAYTAGQIDCVDGYSGTNYGSFKTINELPCKEDEVAAVKIDKDPTHPTTWECVNAQEYVNNYNKGN